MTLALTFVTRLPPFFEEMVVLNCMRVATKFQVEDSVK